MVSEETAWQSVLASVLHQPIVGPLEQASPAETQISMPISESKLKKLQLVFDGINVVRMTYHDSKRSIARPMVATSPSIPLSSANQDWASRPKVAVVSMMHFRDSSLKHS